LFAWTALVLQDFTERRRNATPCTPVPTPSPATPSIPTASVSHDQKALNDFNRSIERSMSDYNELSNDKHFKKWHSATVVTARVHKLEDVINLDFVPTPEKYPLFNEKHLLFYSVLLKNLVMSHAKVHICMYAETSDGQKVLLYW
jgi:hypothetical protein